MPYKYKTPKNMDYLKGFTYKYTKIDELPDIMLKFVSLQHESIPFDF